MAHEVDGYRFFFPLRIVCSSSLLPFQAEKCISWEAVRAQFCSSEGFSFTDAHSWTSTVS